MRLDDEFYVEEGEYGALERLLECRPATAYSLRFGKQVLSHADWETLWLVSQCGVVADGQVARALWNDRQGRRGVTLSAAQNRLVRLEGFGLLAPVEALTQRLLWRLTVDGETELLRRQWVSPREAAIWPRSTPKEDDVLTSLMAAAVITEYVATLTERDAVPLARTLGETFFAHGRVIRATYDERLARYREMPTDPRYPNAAWSAETKRMVAIYEGPRRQYDGEDQAAMLARLALSQPWAPGGPEAILLRHSPEGGLTAYYPALTVRDHYQVSSKYHRKLAGHVPMTTHFVAGNWRVYEDMRGKGLREKLGVIFPPPYDGLRLPPPRWSTYHLGVLPANEEAAS